MQKPRLPPSTLRRTPRSSTTVLVCQRCSVGGCRESSGHAGESQDRPPERPSNAVHPEHCAFAGLGSTIVTRVGGSSLSRGCGQPKVLPMRGRPYTCGVMMPTCRCRAWTFPQVYRGALPHGHVSLLAPSRVLYAQCPRCSIGLVEAYTRAHRVCCLTPHPRPCPRARRMMPARTTTTHTAAWAML